MNLYQIFGHKKINLIFKLWELILLNKSLLILADTPDICSETVYCVIATIFPVVYAGHFRPYFTIFDKNIQFFKQSKGDRNYLFGVTNPLFLNVILKDFGKYTQCFET